MTAKSPPGLSRDVWKLRRSRQHLSIRSTTAGRGVGRKDRLNCSPGLSRGGSSRADRSAPLLALSSLSFLTEGNKFAGSPLEGARWRSLSLLQRSWKFAGVRRAALLTPRLKRNDEARPEARVAGKFKTSAAGNEGYRAPPGGYDAGMTFFRRWINRGTWR